MCYIWHLRFLATNNMGEYEMLITGLHATITLGWCLVWRLLLRNDSRHYPIMLLHVWLGHMGINSGGTECCPVQHCSRPSPSVIISRCWALLVLTNQINRVFASTNSIRVAFGCHCRLRCCSQTKQHLGVCRLLVSQLAINQIYRLYACNNI